DCIWTDWIDVSKPNTSDVNSGDYETFDEIVKNNASWVCVKAENISCRAEKFPNIPIEDLGQKVECDVNTGLICKNTDQANNSYCYNYEISICCIPNVPECMQTTEFTTTISTTLYHSTTASTELTPTVSTTAGKSTPIESPISTTPGT
ncbi:MUC5A protein, partial [Alectura lathami]|nr:MUC5A protein [Alectura lathami]